MCQNNRRLLHLTCKVTTKVTTIPPLLGQPAWPRRRPRHGSHFGKQIRGRLLFGREQSVTLHVLIWRLLYLLSVAITVVLSLCGRADNIAAAYNY